MKILNCKQGSPEWLKARLGIPTASHFGDIVTATGKATSGKTRYNYQLELVGERLTKSAMPHFVSAAMQRGTDLEPEARGWYSFEANKMVKQVGFVMSDCGRWGCSPDGLTELGGVEIKCPGRIAMRAMLDSRKPEPDYVMQIQGCMFVCDRDEWDFVVYSDELGMPSAWWTVERDDVIQAALARELPVFCDELDELEKKIRSGK
jgi:hypothetical protein